MYDPQGDYQNGYNYGKNGGGWRNDMNSNETSGYNAAKQQEEARRFQQIQQQDTQRRQQEEARRTQQQFIDQQAAQQRQQQAAWQQSPRPSARTSYAGSNFMGGGSRSPRPAFVSSGFSSTSSQPFTSTDRKALAWVFLFGVVGVVVYGAMSVMFPYLNGRKMDIAGSELFRAQPTVAEGIYTYAGSDVMKFRWLHDKDHPMHLNGRTVVVTGDVSNANLHVNGNITFQGTLRNVNVIDDDWTITANRVENSALTARKIVVTGEAVGTAENLTAAPSKPRQKRKRR